MRLLAPITVRTTAFLLLFGCLYLHDKVAAISQIAYDWPCEPSRRDDLLIETVDLNLARQGHSRHSEYKQAIRAQFHPQLAELWNTHPAIQKAYERWADHDSKAEIVDNSIVTTFKRGQFRFLPLVTKAAYLVCDLDILFMRQEEKGNVVNQYGDLDNRLKILFDALRMPEHEIPSTTNSVDNPFFCLLEDDSLITNLTAENRLPHASRRRKEPFARLPTAFRLSRPVRQLVFHQAQTGIDNSPGPAL